MNDIQYEEKTNKKGKLIFKIIFSAGVLIALCYLFIPAGKGDIIQSQEIPNLFRAFTGSTQDGTPYIQMLFGHSAKDLISMPPILLELLIFILPIVIMLATVVMIWLLPKSKIGLVLGLIGAVMLLGIDLYLLITGTSFFGVYLNMIGVVIATLGLLLFYIDDGEEEEEEYVVAGVITCKTGTFAGSTFEVPDVVVIGKNPRDCNIVLQNKTISRVHCVIRYVPETDTYTVKDVSSNGTFYADGRTFAKNCEVQVPRGTEIYMGEPRETFYLD